LTRAGLKSLERPFWLATSVAVLLTLARFSEAFLVLRGATSGLHAGLAPLVIVVMNLVYALSGYPVGRLSDRIGRRGLLGWGLVALVAADLALAHGHRAAILAGAALWGLHMGMTQGLLSALIADTAPDTARGTAFGLFHLLTGLTLFAASLAAGGLWKLAGPAAPFQAGALFALLALILSRLVPHAPAGGR
jgi:MFS family permease